MSRLTTEQQQTIREIFNRHRPGKAFVLDRIPANRLQNARESHRIGADEEVIFLYDDTFFNSGRDGIVLTTAGIYGKNAFEEAHHMTYSEFDAVTAGLGAITFKDKSKSNFKVSTVSGTTKKTFEVAQALIAFLIQEDVANLVVTGAKEGQIPVKQNWNCTGCGAPTIPSNKFCEYCGSSV